MKQKDKGFTLIEILVVIAIIGSLLVILIVSVTRSLKRGRDQKRATEVELIKSTLHIYYDKEGTYPANIDELESDGYITALPKDPSDSTSNLITNYTTTTGHNCTIEYESELKGRIETECRE